MSLASQSYLQAPTADWLARMACMVKVEGLVLGGAMDYDAFHDALKSISMVSKHAVLHACLHVLVVTAVIQACIAAETS